MSRLERVMHFACGSSTSFFGRGSVNGAKISLRGTTDSAFGIGQDIALPQGAVDLFEGKRFDPLENLRNGGSGEWNKVRIATHEAHIATIHRDLNNVSGEQRAATVRPARPMQ